MFRYTVGTIAAVAILFGAACGSPASSGGNFIGGEPGGSGGATGAGTGGSGGAGGGTTVGGGAGGGDAGTLPITAFTGLPCDVATVLATRCSSCHGVPLSGGAPIRLETRDDLIATDPISGATWADRCVARMTSATSPMPPTGAPPASETAALQGWIAAGSPPSTCSQVIDAGTMTADAGPAPTTCASGTFWGLGNQGSADMNPGLACKACHASKTPFKNYPYAGTVYPSLHEKDLCDGVVPSNAVVEILDGTGRVLKSMPVSTSSGNFHGGIPVLEQVASWYRARVRANGRVLEMRTPVTTKNGDCNSCHTEQGANGAPGRIVLP